MIQEKHSGDAFITLNSMGNESLVSVSITHPQYIYVLEEPSSPRICKHAGSKGRRQGPNRVKIVKAKCTYNWA